MDESRDSKVVVNSAYLAKIAGHCPSEGGNKASFCMSRDHIINESRDLVGEIPSP